VPLQLHKDCRSRLLNGLRNALKGIEVNNSMFLDRQTMMPLFETNKILPQTGPLRDRLVAYVDDNPFSEFVWDRLTTELWERDKYQSGKRGKLVDIEGYADVDQVATRLLSQFESLPWHFHIHIPMPESLSTILAENESSFLFQRVERRFPAPDDVVRIEGSFRQLTRSGHYERGRWVIGRAASRP